MFYNQIEKTYIPLGYENNLLTLKSPKIQITSSCVFLRNAFISSSFLND